MQNTSKKIIKQAESPALNSVGQRPAELFDNIKFLLTEARKSVVRNINQTMVYTYFEIGRMIVEDEQKGQHRAEYGKQVLIELSRRLSEEFGRGFSVNNLDNMRNFYLCYSLSISQTVSAKLQYIENQNIEKSQTVSGKLSVISSALLTKSLPIGHTLSDQLQNTENQNIEISETVLRKSLPIPHFQLSWSHYLKLMRITDLAERQFYEIETFTNQWSLRELQR